MTIDPVHGIDRFDGSPCGLLIDGVLWSKTGNRNGWPVYAPETDYRKCFHDPNYPLMAMIDAEWLPVNTPTDKVRKFTPYDPAFAPT